jgi:hypothetical protein
MTPATAKPAAKKTPAKPTAAQLQKRIDELEAKLAAPDPTGVSALLPYDGGQAGDFADWPQEGYSGVQPWDLQALGLQHAARELADAGDGAPDTVSPVVCRAGLEMLTSGSRGENVKALAFALGRLGYANSISLGSIDNAFGIVDSSVLSAAQAFRRDYGVAEDPQQFPRASRENAESHIGPITQEAVLRADAR